MGYREWANVTATSIEIERRGRVEIITMRRPDHGNRVDQKMAEEMVAALEVARHSPEVGACVLTGHGDMFCLGGDYQSAGPNSAARSWIWPRRWRGSASR